MAYIRPPTNKIYPRHINIPYNNPFQNPNNIINIIKPPIKIIISTLLSILHSSNFNRYIAYYSEKMYGCQVFPH